MRPNCNQGNEGVRTPYEALCKEPISQQPFWSRYKEHVTRRNEIVHAGERTGGAGGRTVHRGGEVVIYHIRDWFGAG